MRRQNAEIGAERRQCACGIAIGTQQKTTAIATSANTRLGGHPSTRGRVEDAASRSPGIDNSGGWRRKIAASGTTTTASNRPK